LRGLARRSKGIAAALFFCSFWFLRSPACRTLPGLILLTACLCVTAKNANAADLTWVGGNGNWNTQDNQWIYTDGSSGSPHFANGDNVTFGSNSLAGNTITLDDISVLPTNITIETDGTYTFAYNPGQTITAALLTVNGKLTIANDYGNSITSTNINAGGVLTLAGSTTLYTTVNMQSGGTLNINNNGSNGFGLTGSGTVNIGANAEFVGVDHSVPVNVLAGYNLNILSTPTYHGNIATGNNASVTFIRSAGYEIEYSGELSGTGKLIKASAGTLILSNTNTYSGGTEINAGTIVVNNNNALSSGGVSVGASGTLNVNGKTITNGINLAGSLVNNNGTAATVNNVTLTAASTVGGTGDLTINNLNAGSNNLTKTGTNRLILSGNLSSGTPGTLAIDGGSVQLETGYGGYIDVDTGTSVIFNSNSPITQTAAISGGGSVILNGSSSGTLTLSGNNSYSGGTNIGAGSRVIAKSGSALGTGDVTVANAGELEFDHNADVTLSNNMSGGGTIIVNNSGYALTLSGNNSYSGGTNIGAGSKVIAKSGSALGTGDVTNAGELEFDTGADVTFSNKISGSGTIVKTDSKNLFLSGDLSGATGLLDIDYGAVQLNETNYGGDIDVAVNTLVCFNNAGNIEYSKLISGDGGLYKVGSGELTLSNNNTYKGNTNVYDGTLKLTGSLAYSRVLVSQYGTFDYQSASSIAGLETSSGSTILLTKNNPVRVSGSAAIEQGTLFNVTDLDGDEFEQAKTWDLIVAAGGVTGDIIDKEGSLFGGTDEYSVQFVLGGANTLFAKFLSRGLAEESKSLFEGRIASLGMLKEQQDWLNAYGWQQFDRRSRTVQYFGAFTGGQSRYPSGSHVDAETYGVHAGLAKNVGKLSVGAAFNGGHGNYNTFNSFARGDVYGRGEIETYGGSVFAKYYLNSGYYTDSALSFGSSNNKFDTFFNNKAYSYDFNSPYVGFQAGIGREFSLGKGLADVSLRYLGMWEESEDVTYGTTAVHFASGESNRVRLGGRYKFAKRNNTVCGAEPCEAVDCSASARALSGYIGAAWDYEFSGNANGYVGSASILAPSVRGGTAIGEIGVNAKLGRADVFTGVEGYLGKREGVSGNVGAVWRF
jgi:autotransporter-associated beta strand protein